MNQFMQIKPIFETIHFGVKISEIDLNKISLEEAAIILQKLYEHGFLVFDEQKLTEKEYIALGKKLGTLRIFLDPEYAHPEFSEIFVVSNVKRKNKRFGMNRVGLYWHSDGSFLTEPQPITMLYCQIAPAFGGETAFVDMREIFSNISSPTQSFLETTQCEHIGQYRYIISEKDVGLSVKELLERDRKDAPSVIHPAILKHAKTSTKSLYVNPGFTSRILGLDDNSSRKLLTSLFHTIEISKYHYTHTWKKHDIVLWDNRSVLHRAFTSLLNSQRLMFRLGISDGPFFSLEKNK